MKKYRSFIVLSVVLVMMIVCAGFGFYKDFFVENVQMILLTDGTTEQTLTITDPDTIQAITTNVTENLRHRLRGKNDSSGWCYHLRFLDERGEQLASFSVLSSDGHLVSFGGWRYQTANDHGIDTNLLDRLLAP